MPKAIRFSKHGGIDVLDVVEVAKPEPGPGEVLVAVRAAAVNMLDVVIREGIMQSEFPIADYPSGQGIDFAGVIDAVGPDVVGRAVGDEVLGFQMAPGNAQAEYLLASSNQIIDKPAGVSWDIAGGLYTAGTAAYAAVRAVRPQPGETVVVIGATGGVGSIAVQLARRTGAKVIGVAGPDSHAWLSAHGVTPVAYGNDLQDRLEVPDAFIDAFGGGYVKLAIEPRGRAGADQHGDRLRGGGEVRGAGRWQLGGRRSKVLAELAALVDKGELEMPIAATYSLDQVREAFGQLEQRHTLGKIILRP